MSLSIESLLASPIAVPGGPFEKTGADSSKGRRGRRDEGQVKTLGILLLAAHLTFLTLGALLLGGSIGAFLGETPMIVSGVLTMVLWGAYAGCAVYAVTRAAALIRGDAEACEAALAWSNGLFLAVAVVSALTGLPLAFGAFASCGPLWVSPLYHWAGMVGTVLGFAAYFFLPLVVRACLGDVGDAAPSHRWWLPLVTALPVALIWGLAWLVAWLILSGSIKESDYPARAGSPYKLPFPGGEDSWVIQGNDSGLNHNGDEKHAWDFRRRCGSPVLAARGGTIRANPVDSNDGHGSNNYIEIDHGDGTVGRYLHIQKGSIVKRSGTVAQGDVLAKAGNVGNSLTGHIHFVVERSKKSIPVSFADVTDDRGIPRTFGSYTSGNRK
jgi:hypothetical protein